MVHGLTYNVVEWQRSLSLSYTRTRTRVTHHLLCPQCTYTHTFDQDFFKEHATQDEEMSAMMDANILEGDGQSGSVYNDLLRENYGGTCCSKNDLQMIPSSENGGTKTLACPKLTSDGRYSTFHGKKMRYTYEKDHKTKRMSDTTYFYSFWYANTVFECMTPPPSPLLQPHESHLLSHHHH